MKNMPPLIRRLIPLAPAAFLALCGAALVFYSTRPFGAGVSTDSVSYLAAARSWMAGHGVLDYSGAPLNMWPGLYPMLLGSAGFLLGRDPLTLADLLNTSIFGLTIFCASLYFRRVLPDKPLFAFFGSAAVLFSAPFFFVVQWAWSEPLYNLLLVLSLLLMEVYLTGRKTSVLAALAVCTGLAALTRYLGVTLVLWGGLVLMLSGDSWKNRIKNSVVFLAVSGVFPAAWMLRNYLLTGFPMGPRGASAYTLAVAAGMARDVLVSWVFPSLHPWREIGAVIALLLLAGLLWLGRRELRGAARRFLAGSWRAGLYLLAFVGFMGVSIFFSAPDIDSRMISPMYFPLVIIVTVLLAELSVPLMSMKPAWLSRTFFITLFTAWVLFILFGVTLRQISDSHDYGGGLNGANWRNNALVQELKESGLEGKCRVYTNYPAGLFFLAGMQGSRSLDAQGFSILQEQGQTGVSGAVWPPEGKACLVWFTGRKNGSLLNANALKEVANMEVMYKDKSGAIYMMTAR